MNRINILPVNLRNKIAAGEVVERPASVVKELVENSLDSGAGRIEVETARAGKKLIRVSDNGMGMERDDALLAFERYATSKIREEEDLYGIETMGFRGEALSSIASVARIRMTTSPGGGVGTSIEIVGGEVKDVRDCACTGTSMEVRDLFFNTPARRKFLRSDTTEGSHIVDTVTREALSHWSVGFLLRMEGDALIDLPPASSPHERIMQLFGREIAEDLLEAEGADGPLTVRAFVGRTSLYRNNRTNQFLFINRRPIKDQSIAYAVYKAYEGLIPKDKHPIFFLFMEINPHAVDVNVHPAKREVRFEDKNGIFETVYRTARKALWQKAQPVVPEPQAETPSGSFSREDRYDPISVLLQGANQERVSEPFPLYAPPARDSVPFLYLGDTLVAIEEKAGLTVMDYHAAHERINYERLLKGLEIPSHHLLFPRQVRLSVKEHRVMLENQELLGRMGLEVDDFGQSTVIVRALPDFLMDADPESFLSDLASSLVNPVRDGLDPVESLKRSVAARLACHSSIRGKGEVPDGRRIAEILKGLESAENPHQCPHGRPTRISFSLDELKRMFRK
ncbi:MAG: DNA mismatch repair endonuclease MutL [Nitrospirales bacterium]|nr:DNA mismatch repair endonuclease MutL [Nitrospirales bacterium]